MMNIFNRHIVKDLYTFILLLGIVLLYACSNEDNADDIDAKSAFKSRFNFDINVENIGTRAFVNQENIASLCTPNGNVNSKPSNSDSNSESIGLITDLLFKSASYKDVQDRYIAQQMAYFAPKADNNVGWHYFEINENGDAVVNDNDEVIVDNKYWVGGTKMACVTFYPFKYLTASSRKWVTTSASATKFDMEYSTIESQKDVLVGYNIVDSDTRVDKDNNVLKTDDGDCQSIPIVMEHALAALRFKFKIFEGELSDYLTSCSLYSSSKIENKDNFGLAGSMEYYTKKVQGSDSEYEKNVVWTILPCDDNYDSFIWKNNEHIEIKTTPDATAYTGTNSVTENQMYCDNDGFILIIPQAIPENLYLKFTTANGGSQNATKIKLYNNELQEWEHNKRYTYTITLSKAGITWSVDVEGWENIKSNTSIDF